MARSAPSDPHGALLRAVSDGEPAAPKSRALGAGKLIAGRYKLRELIARGGMATIWEAEDDKLGRVVAVKFLGNAYAGSEEYRARFEVEARAAAQLSSPYVVQTHDHGAEGGVPFIVMERLYGEDLQARLQRLGRLPLPMLGKLATQCGRALRAAHAAGIVHRDLKPRNLFLAQSADGETVKLLDFGVARQTDVSLRLTAGGVALGSPHYMSPEQVRSERDLDARSDLWSFAAILYRAVTGVKAFDGDLGRVLTAITEEPHTAPSKLCPDLPAPVDAFFERALAKSREERFQSVDELTTAFEAAMKRRAGTSGVRPITMRTSELEAALEAERFEVGMPTPVQGIPMARPSDHPTCAVPAPLFDRLSGGLAAPPTGLRLGEAIAPPAPLPGDRITLTNEWHAGAPLTVEQEHGFSDPARRSSPSPWDIDDGSGPTSLPARVENRTSPYAAAGLAIIAAVAVVAVVLALVLH